MSDTRLAPLHRLSRPAGLVEHPDHARPPTGFCVDDVSRAMVVVARETDHSGQLRQLGNNYLTFLLSALQTDGTMHNRRDADGLWTDTPSTGDHWGRAVWAFGVVVGQRTHPWSRMARLAFRTAARTESPLPRATAYAALGAAEVHRRFPSDREAARMLVGARERLPRPRSSGWPWPEARLTYANAVLPEALMVVGYELGDARLLAEGTALLDWLVEEQIVEGHLSLVPAGGRGPDDPRPGFDQRPIEAAVLDEACRTAYEITGEHRWAAVVETCLSWFAGDNDALVPMRDPSTNAGYDALTRHGRDENQGAESTLAWLATRQVAGLLTHRAVG